MTFIPISEYYNENTTSILFNYDSLEDIKHICYKDVNIGYGLVSTFVSFTRNISPIIDTEVRNFFDKYLEQKLSIFFSKNGNLAG